MKELTIETIREMKNQLTNTKRLNDSGFRHFKKIYGPDGRYHIRITDPVTRTLICEMHSGTFIDEAIKTLNEIMKEEKQ